MIRETHVPKQVNPNSTSTFVVNTTVSLIIDTCYQAISIELYKNMRPLRSMGTFLVQDTIDKNLYSWKSFRVYFGMSEIIFQLDHGILWYSEIHAIPRGSKGTSNLYIIFDILYRHLNIFIIIKIMVTV